MVEQQLENLAVRAQKQLILLWKEDTVRPKKTADWLDHRGWISAHHHLRVQRRMFSRRSPRKLMELYRPILAQPPNIFSDVSRLARCLTSHSIGLVLGGGGARGAAHVGILKALKEQRIPVDIVAGVSIGAFIGGVYCADPDISNMYMKVKKMFQEAASFWPKIFDLTYPVCAMFTGESLNKMLRRAFGDLQIEDLWIPYFNVTTDITSSEMRIHRSGTASQLFCLFNGIVDLKFILTCRFFPL
ncbi:unnamed protein product [Soboliphyme baturini]|uniref:PNPLA domain-containing protein n=1 Tax=Soboliphyme baturini TaxID=241478 RepID=A0A183I965_9BILA|nr:unnamed protein product [Soboliphyme baturini]